MNWFKPDRFTHRMLEKYQGRKSGLKAVTDFRDMKQYITNATKAGKVETISKRLKEFANDDSLYLDYLNIKSADVTASARRIQQNVMKLFDEINKIDYEEYYGEEDLWKSFDKLARLIIKKLKESGRRFDI
jgi:ParB family chromosome partitioning protein